MTVVRPIESRVVAAGQRHIQRHDVRRDTRSSDTEQATTIVGASAAHFPARLDVQHEIDDRVRCGIGLALRYRLILRLAAPFAIRSGVGVGERIGGRSYEETNEER